MISVIPDLSNADLEVLRAMRGENRLSPLGTPASSRGIRQKVQLRALMAEATLQCKT